MPCNKIHIKGSVFKNGFRYYLKQQAMKIGVSGIVYYKSDRSIGVIVSGLEEKLTMFIGSCQEASQFFQIDNMEVVEITDKEFSSFEVVDDISDDNNFINAKNNNEH